jgi:thioredoxin reductase
MFSPWKYALDAASVDLLSRQGWTAPDPGGYPTGNDLVAHYLEPLARIPELAPRIQLDTRVVAVSRRGRDRMKDTGRAEAPFVVRVRRNGADQDEEVLARAVIDASATVDSHGALGSSGLPAIGESSASGRLRYGIPDVLGRERSRYANRRVMVAGSGHSALNVLLDLAALAADVPGTRVQWVIRRDSPAAVLGGGSRDQLEERGKLGLRVRRLLEDGRVEVVTGFHIDRVEVTPEGLVVGADGRRLEPVDEIVVATGFRPDWSLLSEVRLDLDPSVESPRALAPLIDPNVHSCGTVPPHGAEELKHPEANLFAIGMKSYGRAPTFLLLTGYEQARSVVSAIAGDWDAARRVELVLPETGVCSTDRPPIAAAGQPAAACCETVLLSTCCGSDEKAACCGSEEAPSACGCSAPSPA